MKVFTTTLLQWVLFFSSTLKAYCSHFRGGTVSWRPTGNTHEAELTFKMGWTYGHGPGCTETQVGQLMTSSMGSWVCTQGCSSPVNVGDTSYYCKGANPTEDWEQGERSFTYTFNGQGPYTVGFSGGDWISLNGGKGGGNWNLETVIDLRQRSDTGQPNSSPMSLSKPIYYSQFGCKHTLQIPVVDPDGDHVRCRPATGNECQSVCDALPGVTLDPDTCTLSFRADSTSTYTAGGIYAVSLTLEDSPTSPITVGGQAYNPGDVLTSVPVQFLIQTPTSSMPCDWKPAFVNDTPADGARIVLKAGDTLDLRLYATNSKNPNVTISSIQVLGPRGLNQGSVGPDDKGRTNVFSKQLTWTPTQADAGPHILCAIAEDVTQRSSDSRCFTVVAWDVDPCNSTPCQNGGTCTRVGISTFTCTCIPGYTDFVCSTDIDECASGPCQHNGTCVDQVNSFRCVCPRGFTDLVCSTDVDECVSGPCQNGGTCNDLAGQYNCTCAPGFKGSNCEIGINHCASAPCLNSGICTNGFQGYTCQCQGKWIGKNCAFLLQSGKNNTVNIVQNWPILSQLINQQYACPRTFYSNCHCIIARNLHEPDEDDSSRSVRDALAALVGLPIGLALGVATYLLTERGPRGCLSTLRSFVSRHCTSTPEVSRSPGSHPRPRPIQVAPETPGKTKGGGWGLDPLEVSGSAGRRNTNIYRATFGDTFAHATAVKKRPDTYQSGRADWAE